MKNPSKKLKVKKVKVPFHRLSKVKKRIRIAQDVINSLKTHKIEAFGGSYVNLSCDIPSVVGQDLRDVLNANRCQVCALGSLFVEMIREENNFKINEYEWKKSHLHKSRFGSRLYQYFDRKQLDMIECAFEKECGYGDLNDNEESSDFPIVKKCISFGNRYLTDNTRLIGIMKNIIKNNGTFKP